MSKAVPLTKMAMRSLEWENLPPLVHISHCKAAPDLIYGCVPPLLLSLLS
ncbi:hypothetical protein Scep_029755 [Stephania cephalantha]|uniref:Uncharacterized protein n=1 Tax=Stephania cephalantha TaxID=152367 RepID=A0AAP0DYA2_9MAGN